MSAACVSLAALAGLVAARQVMAAPPYEFAMAIPLPGEKPLKLPATMPTCNGIITYENTLDFANACAALVVDPDLFTPLINPDPLADSDALKQHKTVLVLNAMLRLHARPGDADVAVPNGPNPIGLLPRDGGNNPCSFPNPLPTQTTPGGFSPNLPTCNMTASLASAISQHLFGVPFDPAYSGLIIRPVPIGISPPGGPPNHGVHLTSPLDTQHKQPGCTPPSSEDPDSRAAFPMPHGDGPKYCAATAEPDGNGGWRNPCDNTPIPGDASDVIDKPDVPICVSSGSSPCSPPTPDPIDDPSGSDVPSGQWCASTNPCVASCADYPCDTGDPISQPDLTCNGMCDPPKAPPPPVNTTPDPGMDPDGIAKLPIDLTPPESKAPILCGDTGSAVAPSAAGGAAGVSPTTCHPVDLVHGFKMEQETDLTIPLTGMDFHLVRHYSTNPTDIAGPGLFGAGWSCPLFEQILIQSDSESNPLSLILIGARPNRHTRFRLDGSIFRPMGASRNEAVIDHSGPVGVVRYTEPGVGVTEYFADPGPTQGYIKSKRDEHGNQWTFVYRHFAPTGTNNVRLSRIYFNGDSLATAEAFVEFGHYIAPSSTHSHAGRVARVIAARIHHDGDEHTPIETHRLEYTYKAENDPFPTDVGTPGDLIQVVKYARVDSTPPDDVGTERLFGPGYPHRATVVQYRYHDGSTWYPALPCSTATVRGKAHTLKSTFRAGQLEYYAELLHRGQPILGGKSFSVRDAAFRLMLLPDCSLAVRRDAEAYTVNQIASKVVGYEETGSPAVPGDRVAVQYLQSGCGCGGGGGVHAVKEEYSRHTDSSEDWKSTKTITSTWNGTGWDEHSIRWVDSERKTISAGGVESTPYLGRFDVFQEGAAMASGTPRRWATEYKYDDGARLEEVRSPGPTATASTPSPPAAVRRPSTATRERASSLTPSTTPSRRTSGSSKPASEPSPPAQPSPTSPRRSTSTPTPSTHTSPPPSNALPTRPPATTAPSAPTSATPSTPAAPTAATPSRPSSPPSSASSKPRTVRIHPARCPPASCSTNAAASSTPSASTAP